MIHKQTFQEDAAAEPKAGDKIQRCGPQKPPPYRRMSILMLEDRTDNFENVFATSDNMDKRKMAYENQNGIRNEPDMISNKSSVIGKRHVNNEDCQDRSWWYVFCIKCRSRESHPSWQPMCWRKFCPYPFCPTYRQFSRVISLIIIGFLSWCVIYSLVGDTATPPNGKLFQLILISISSYLVGWVLSLTTLPALIGMLFTGLFLQNVGIVNLDESFFEVANRIRHGALVIILIRAGLDLDPKALWRLKFIVVRLSLIPWLIEAVVCALATRYLLGMAWRYTILLGTIIAAVAPAVVVPCLFRLRSKGYGVTKGIPTLIIAVAGIDDALSVAGFGIIKSVTFSNSSLTSLVLQGPVSILGGFCFGIAFGLLLKYVPERNDKFLVPFRVIMLLAAGMAAIYFSDHLGYGGAGPLGAVVAAFVALKFWTVQGWSIEENPVSTAFEIFWMIVEPVLFGITGAQMRLNELKGSVVMIGFGIVVLGVAVRIVGTMIIGIGCNLNLKEKIFCALAWMPKATVQAALAPIVLSEITDTTSEEYKWAKKIIVICILSIMFTTTTGATLVSLLGTKLLRKTKFAVEPDLWRRSHRPSVRDISIFDEDEEEKEADDAENNSVITLPENTTSTVQINKIE
ncbi:sodium/hydrogen exchanger 9B2-like isoform X2 [Cylas formicarius]|uniref:sodium/hydrogen exchanger 9B2-like isoform X2 n=1 Tax=Cylas formicarius TaxID=197179 RepID=UPI002958919C|nr:sodium/hydrogen exchanger 9B2-like isoform X2 [Cylas formicarius]